MNIYQKISEVMKKVEYLTKDDSVSFGTTKYRAISEEKVTSTIREQLVNLGIVILPVKQDATVTELMRTDKSVNQRADVHTVYRIQNIDDTEDFILVESNGSGVDTQDKAVGKAMTYAYKYMLLRSFAIPTGEDPDKIASAETDAKLGNETINAQMEDALRTLIDTKQIPNETVIDILKENGYKKLKDIKISDLTKVRNQLARF
jgi:hypothetical protein